MTLLHYIIWKPDLVIKHYCFDKKWREFCLCVHHKNECVTYIILKDMVWEYIKTNISRTCCCNRVIVAEFIVFVVIQLSLSSDHYRGICMELPLSSYRYHNINFEVLL